MPRKCATVAVTPLARELISYVAEIGPLLRSRASDRRLTQVLLDQIRELSELPFHLPQTSFDITALLRWDLSVDQAAGEMGFSKRTLERRIFEETKLSLGAWRQQARLIESLQLLAGGQSVTNTAFRVGYQSASAFIVAFKRAFGVAPGAFYA
jgi:AraC-like DNA-binding protein